MNRTELIHRTADLTVSRFDHPPHEAHHDPEREVADGWAIAFVQSGTFDVVERGARRRLRAGSVFITRPGLEFRCEHGERCPDDVCVSVRFDPTAVAAAEDAWVRAGWIAREAATPRLAYTHARLTSAVDARDSFETERWALGALSALEADAASTPRGRYAARRADLDAVIATCRDIELDPAARRSIANRARDVGVTGTQLTHFFRRYVGVSPHKYVIRCRLAASAELLNGGATVSESCYRAGFENLSHFCRTFQRSFGVRASAWRSASLRERRRKVQDLAERHA